jgi:hypothetical protein
MQASSQQKRVAISPAAGTQAAIREQPNIDEVPRGNAPQGIPALRVSKSRLTIA